MFDIEKWGEIWQTMRKNPLRTIMTAFGVFWGMMMLVAMVGAGSGLENGININLEGIAANGVYVWGGRASKPYQGMKAGRIVMLKNDDITAIEMNIKGIKHLAPRMQLGGYQSNNNVTRGEETGSFSIMGDVPAFIHLELMDVHIGRFINQKDLDEKRKVAIIGDRVYNILFKDRADPLGENITINGVAFIIAGVFNSGKKKLNDAQKSMETIYIPFTTFQQAFNMPNSVHWFSMIVEDGHDPNVIEDEVKALLKKRHKVAPDDPRGLGSWNTAEEFKPVKNSRDIIDLLVWIAGLGTLLSGVIGVGNIMLIIVKERTREIGVRKAIGATPMAIISMILHESVVLTLIAGVAGLFCGLGLVKIMAVLTADMPQDERYFIDPSVDPLYIAVALLILLITGLLAGLLPARQAASINPIHALKSE